MPTEQEAKPAVVTPSLQQWRSPSTFRGAPGEDPLKWLKERAEEQLKCRAQRSGESTQSYIQSVLGLWSKSSDERRRKSVTPNERCC
ncbi:hypothetical protein TNCV_1787471 [Trichonephila clavipes]|nr:hypothetical protein TNCV_1787471 [Trichonephila clavipes]